MTPDYRGTFERHHLDAVGFQLAAQRADAGHPGEKLTCSKHLWEFNARTGCGINPDDARLKSFGCQVGDDGTIYVDIGH